MTKALAALEADPFLPADEWLQVEAAMSLECKEPRP